MTDDPWSELRPPASPVAANAKPVGGDARPGFYWMLDFDRHCLLGLRHAKGLALPGQLPRLKGIQVEIVAFADDVDILIFKLLESTNKGIFYSLCTDIIASASTAPDERQAIAAALGRTWRWHYLLKGGSDRRLSPEEQKGLIGELRVLRDHLAQVVPVGQALEMWTGPFGAPKDFEIGRIAIEAKAHRGAARPLISISSEYQLDSADFEQVFLHVINLARPGPSDHGFSLSEVVDEVRSYVNRQDASASDAVEVRLAAAGYRDDDDYSDSTWMQTSTQIYEVVDGFPRITTSTLVAGVQHVRYEVALPECQPFAVSEDALRAAICGVIDV